jgi:hypothetical protein
MLCSDAWLSILRLPLPATLYKRALTVLPLNLWPKVWRAQFIQQF